MVLKENAMNPKEVTMGSHLENMLNQCDGALLIGDRALQSARSNPELVKLDLGKAPGFNRKTERPSVYSLLEKIHL